MVVSGLLYARTFVRSSKVLRTASLLLTVLFRCLMVNNGHLTGITHSIIRRNFTTKIYVWNWTQLLSGSVKGVLHLLRRFKCLYKAPYTILPLVPSLLRGGCYHQRHYCFFNNCAHPGTQHILILPPPSI